MAAGVVAKLRHHQWGPCQLVRVEATDWIVRVESTGLTHRVPSERRSQFEIVHDLPLPVVAAGPSVEAIVPMASSAARKARRAIESLRVGLPTLDGSTRQLAVGFTKTERLLDGFLRDIDVDGGRAMVLKGGYGQGKTFALTVLQDMAQERGFITSRMEIDATENRLNKPHHIYRNLMRNLRLPGTNGPGVPALVSMATDLLVKECPGNACQREQWLEGKLGCFPLAWLLSDPNIMQKPHLLGLLECDPNFPAVCARRYHVNPPPPRHWPAFNAGTQGDFASFVLSGIGRLARLLGFKGFLVILDEMEKWHELNWLEQSRAGNLLGGLIWGAVAEQGRRADRDRPPILKHSQRCGGYPFTIEQRAHIGVAVAMTPREEAADPEGIWCQYGPILIANVPRFTKDDLNRYSVAVVPVFAKAYGLSHPNRAVLDGIADDAFCIWRGHGDLNTRSGVQAVIAAFDKWRDRMCLQSSDSSP